MTRQDQADFVEDLSNSITKSILEQIHYGKIPENWDGHELRALLAFRHEENARISLIRISPRSSRTKAFNNTIVVHNL